MKFSLFIVCIEQCETHLNEFLWHEREGDNLTQVQFVEGSEDMVGDFDGGAIRRVTILALRTQLNANSAKWCIQTLFHSNIYNGIAMN